ncbi:hypothetical protein JTB14_017013 [Gonioctena quinquepunctata]|nr:hypothetical protein JTB14_017013 [Gonioctena quinquepunctata]
MAETTLATVEGQLAMPPAVAVSRHARSTQLAIEDDRTIGTDGLPEPGPSNQLNDHSSRPDNSELPALRAIQTEANQLLSAATSDPSPKSPQPGPSGLQATSTQLILFSSEDIRPLPGTETKRKYKKRKTAILTDTPEKNAIEEEYNPRNKDKKTIFQPHTGKGKRTMLTAKGKGKGKKTKNPPGSKGKENQSEANSKSSDDEDYYCLVSSESFRNSAPNETWVQCGDCKNWSHAACIKDYPYYVCHNCESE